MYLCIVSGPFPAMMTELNSSDRDHMALKDKIIYYLALYRKKAYQPLNSSILAELSWFIYKILLLLCVFLGLSQLF